MLGLHRNTCAIFVRTCLDEQNSNGDVEMDRQQVGTDVLYLTWTHTTAASVSGMLVCMQRKLLPVTHTHTHTEMP